MRVLIHGLNYEPEIIGISIYTAGLAEFLSKSGHDVTVVTAHPYYPEWRRRPNWKSWAYYSERANDFLNIIHCPLFVPRSPSFLRRMVHYLSFLLSSFPVSLWKSLQSRPNVIISIAPSLIAAVGVVICGRLFGSKLVLHIQDFEVDAAFATNAISKHGVLGRLALSFERWMLCRFDMVSTISDAMMRKAVDKGVPKERIVEFRNWADLSGIAPFDSPSPLRDELELGEKHIILYSGNIAAKQGISIIPAVARILIAREDITFVICGNGPYLEALKKSCKGLGNVRFLPLQPLEKLNELLGMADIHLLPQIAGVQELVLPSKLANMLASGKPVIATAAPDSALAKELDGCGLIVPPGDEIALADAIVLLIDNPNARHVMGKASRSRALSRWDAVQILGRYGEQLTHLARMEPIVELVKDKTI